MSIRSNAILVLIGINGVTGILFLFTGLAYRLTYDPVGDIIKLQKRTTYLLPIIIIVFGLYMILKASIELYCQFTGYSTEIVLACFLGVCIVSYILAGILLLFNRVKISDAIQNGVTRCWNRRRKHRYAEIWDKMQSRLKCCGMFDWRDWGDKVPETCTKGKDNGCLTAVTLYIKAKSWANCYSFAMTLINILQFQIFILMIMDPFMAVILFRDHIHDLVAMFSQDPAFTF